LEYYGCLVIFCQNGVNELLINNDDFGLSFFCKLLTKNQPNPKPEVAMEEASLILIFLSAINRHKGENLYVI